MQPFYDQYQQRFLGTHVLESKQQDSPFKNHLGVGLRIQFQSGEKLGIGLGKDIQIQVATRIATLFSEAKRLIFMEAFGFNLKAWGFAYHNSPPSDIAIAAIQKCLLGQITWMGKNHQTLCGVMLRLDTR